MAKEPHTIILRPRHSRLTVECRVYDTHRSMLHAIRNDARSRVANSTAAATCRSARGAHKRSAAIVFFNRRDMSRGVIAHEMVHAAFNILERRRIGTDEREVEESIATFAGILTDEFHSKYSI